MLTITVLRMQKVSRLRRSMKNTCQIKQNFPSVLISLKAFVEM